MTDTTLKTRFCPSPSGLLHLGNTRTALFNALLAKGQQGVFLLRMEDSDRTRSQKQYADAAGEDLQWLGLPWDEGIDVGGEHGPYWQSQRQDIYDRYYDVLIEKQLAYPCFCSDEELAIHRKLQLSQGKPPRYSGICRDLTDAKRQEKRDAGIKPTLRFRVPDGETITFCDLVRGEQRFNCNDIGDFIIRRKDGTSPFLYANALDDALMKVTHALRGDDHIANTPRQLLLLRALDLPAPSYGHITLIVGSDGSPLSKRHGSRSVQELRQQGYLPLAIVNYLARLGHHYEDDGFMPLQILAEKFSVDALSRAPARFDEAQLHYWQKQAVLALDNDALWSWCQAQVIQWVPAEKRDAFVELVRPNVLFPQDTSHWAQVCFSDDWQYDDALLPLLQEAGTEFFTTAAQAWQNSDGDYQAICQAIKSQLNIKGKALFQPLRIALTNARHGPELMPFCQLSGFKRIAQRLQRVSHLVESNDD